MYALKVTDAKGETSMRNYFAAVEWAVDNKKEGRGCIINISLGMSYLDIINAAVSRAVDLGCVVVVAAGNSNIDACKISPASEPKAITVGSIDKTDWRADKSNWGRCLTVFAPGDKIHSTSIDGKATVKSGTSMAAPHVAGLAANVMSKTKNYQPADVLKEIIENSQRKELSLFYEKSPNLLASNIALNSFGVKS
ncbi:hypothetical protein DSO57_1008825 [Entomophthora muscae]|uniref:Uncharacterized protein n=1 Tax=Entomophthora muscae TaxID=34485 RepID=A0ACC2RLT4_9FUNG|nr:hypothetical protein DSO57_1008825 [Entomophthora muscae]